MSDFVDCSKCLKRIGLDSGDGYIYIDDIDDENIVTALKRKGYDSICNSCADDFANDYYFEKEKEHETSKPHIARHAHDGRA